MKQTEIIEFNPIIYPFKLWVCVKTDLNVIKTNFCSYTGDELNIKWPENGIACTLPVQRKDTGHNGVLIVTGNKKFSVSTIAHESVHAADCLFDYIGAYSQSFEEKNEPYAYLVGWIADCIEAVNKNRYEDTHTLVKQS